MVGAEGNQSYRGADGCLRSVLQSWHTQSLSLSCQPGWGSEQPDLMEDVPTHDRELELGDL